MFLDLRLPAGWTQAPIGGAPAPVEPAGTGPLLQALAATPFGTILWPPKGADEADDAAVPSALLLSPLLPLLRSPTQLLQAALDSEPDYERSHETQFFSARLGPWEVTLLETEGKSRETGIISARIYAVMDVGHAAFMLVWVDCEPSRLAQRREQLAELLSQARLRRTRPSPVAPAEAEQSPPEAPIPAIEPVEYTLDAALNIDDSLGPPTTAEPTEPDLGALATGDPAQPEAAFSALDLRALSATSLAVPSDEATEAADTAEGVDAATAAPPTDEDSPTAAEPAVADDPDPAEALPTPPQRPAEAGYRPGVLVPPLID